MSNTERTILRSIPVLCGDEDEREVSVLVKQLRLLTGLPFELRKIRYGCRPDQYACVLAYNKTHRELRGYDNVIRVAVPPKVKEASYMYSSPKSRLERRMSLLAKNLVTRHFSS